MKNKITTKSFAVFTAFLLLLLSGINSNAQTCGIPQNLHINNLTSNSGILEWNNVTGATDYIIRIQVAGSNSWRRLTSSNNTEIVTALIPNTQYEVKVRTTCSLIEKSPTNQILKHFEKKTLRNYH